MSRGLGHLQRQMLEALAPKRPGDIPQSSAAATDVLARRVFGLPWMSPISPAQRASASRALNGLRRLGLVETSRRNWSGRSVAVWHLTESAWRSAETLRQQRSGAAR